jgi:hypothetical protein
LAFHPYPQVIPPVFNLGGFGPPRGLTRASACPWIDHTASGLGPATHTPCSDSLSLRLPVDRLTSLLIANSPAHSSKGTLSPPHRHAPKDTPPRRLQLLVGSRFQVLFHSPPGVLFTIPSRYYPLSVAGECLALWGGPHRFVRDFTGPALLGSTEKRLDGFRLRDCYPLRSAFPCRFDYPRAL